jgi:hypothetical protein
MKKLEEEPGCTNESLRRTKSRRGGQGHNSNTYKDLLIIMTLLIKLINARLLLKRKL